MVDDVAIDSGVYVSGIRDQSWHPGLLLADQSFRLLSPCEALAPLMHHLSRA